MWEIVRWVTVPSDGVIHLFCTKTDWARLSTLVTASYNEPTRLLLHQIHVYGKHGLDDWDNPAQINGRFNI